MKRVRCGVRRMWVNPIDFEGENWFKLYKHTDPSEDRAAIQPVYVVPATPEAVEALVEKAAQAAMNWERNRYGRLGNSNTETYRMQARAVLVSLFGPLPGGKKGATTRSKTRGTAL